MSHGGLKAKRKIRRRIATLFIPRNCVYRVITHVFVELSNNYHSMMKSFDGSRCVAHGAASWRTLLFRAAWRTAARLAAWRTLTLRASRHARFACARLLVAPRAVRANNDEMPATSGERWAANDARQATNGEWESGKRRSIVINSLSYRASVSRGGLKAKRKILRRDATFLFHAFVCIV